MTFSSYTTKKINQIFLEFETSKNGLDEKESFLRQKKYKRNEIVTKKIHWRQILFRQFKSPFVYLLIFASLLAFILKDNINGVMILIFVLITAGLGFFQEYRSEQALRFLKQYIISRAKVVREGKEKLIDSRDLVCGDIVVIEAGDIIPADLRFFEEENLIVDEEALSGESAPVKKSCQEQEKAAEEIYQAQNIGFCGTKAVGGFAKGVVLATGLMTVFGRTAKLTIETRHISTFEKEIIKFSKFILRLILITLILVFFTNLLIKGQEANFVELLIFAIALAVSVIPEALPLVTTVSLSKGAMHLAKKHVVIKRLSAIEDLGSIGVLCTDKTGTLTENILSVDQIYASAPKECLFYAALAFSFLSGRRREPNNAFDLALYEKLTKEEKNKLNEYQRLKEIPFDPEKKRNAVLVERNNQKEIIVRGAPEVILDLCEIPKEEKNKFLNLAAKEGKEGKRSIAIAKKEIENEQILKENGEGLVFLGLITFFDPLKKSARQAISSAKKLGVKIKILTGDSREVAGAVAVRLGLIKDQNKVISGGELDKLPILKQHQVVNDWAVFSRLSPIQKYKIIKILQEKNEVGFLGEGINDAPALKLANVAMVVQGGADIAQEASDIVLLKKNLNVIIQAIRDGREVFTNTIKYIKATLISNFGNFYAIAFASLLIAFLPMLPLQILLVNLLSDFPMIAIATDLVDERELKKPKNYNVKEVILIATILGLVSVIFDFIVFALFYQKGAAILQTNWFIVSILTELVLIFSVRSRFIFFRGKRPSFSLSLLSIAAFLATLIIPFTLFGQEIFKFIKPQPFHLLIILLLIAVYFICTEIVKLIYYRIFNKVSVSRS
ncbi:MAG: HAD-IC family P-type ATPase [Patescibacteria group bacterium]